ncbi:hypothetical protein I203_106247 [Kwoniella mangroviensis CBS 8507]|uniref:uncharacterized protein n=1 Tax=Kwoniella mangroviensis CBS 8507 TaxID=1296122 RepID=UPI00080D78D1|nr:uncharacterized protein I203_04721 [Kwoniella mangroviensis CBS 8507]OCF66388.1 hypothetical protein I203_04721 [Kwoniella mangroviensis CBS 8507]
MPKSNDGSDTNDSVKSLPTFEGLYGRQSITLLRPFSRFSISSLFRSSPAPSNLPATTLLDPLILISFTVPSDPLPALDHITKSLEGLKDFATQLKETIHSQNLDIEHGTVGERIEKLLQAYLAGIYVLSRLLWDNISDCDAQKNEDHKAALKQCIQGFFLLFPQVQTGDDIHKHILGSIFPSTQTRYYQLSPLLQHPRQLISSLQSQPTRPIAHSKLKDPIQSPVRSSFLDHVPESEVLYAISLLDTFLEGMQGVECLPGPMVAKTKRQKEDDKRRPLRVEMEARVMKCDLLMSMTTKRIGEVKSRAMRKIRSDVEQEGEGAEHNEGDDGGQQVKDIKPTFSSEDDPENPHGTTGSSDDTRWEDLSEECLVECLDMAKKLIEGGRAEVLSNHIEAVDWLGQDGIIQPDKQEATRRSKSPSRDVTGGSDSEDEDESDLGSESEISEESAFGTTHPCPLRSIFRLHDRYEEQRLAVWLHLPSAKRGKMGRFMRGLEGRVGSSWDNFGLAAMVEYDSETLMSYGLGSDKLDKWVELASMRNAKKIKRKGRKTV